MNRKISLGMAVTIVILAMTVTFSITMLIAMRLFDSTVNSEVLIRYLPENRGRRVLLPADKVLEYPG